MKKIKKLLLKRIKELSDMLDRDMEGYERGAILHKREELEKFYKEIEKIR